MFTDEEIEEKIKKYMIGEIVDKDKEEFLKMEILFLNTIAPLKKKISAEKMILLLIKNLVRLCILTSVPKKNILEVVGQFYDHLINLILKNGYKQESK